MNYILFVISEPPFITSNRSYQKGVPWKRPPTRRHPLYVPSSKTIVLPHSPRYYSKSSWGLCILHHLRQIGKRIRQSPSGSRIAKTDIVEIPSMSINALVKCCCERDLVVNKCRVIEACNITDQNCCSAWRVDDEDGVNVDESWKKRTVWCVRNRIENMRDAVVAALFSRFSLIGYGGCECSIPNSGTCNSTLRYFS